MTDQLPFEIKKILEAQNLELIEILQRPDTPRRRFYNLRVRSGKGGSLAAEGSDLVLKIFGRGDPSVISGFEKEVEFLRLVTELGGGGLERYVPRFLSRGGGRRQPWYLREYIAGEFLGDICFDFGIKSELLTPALGDAFLGFFKNLLKFSECISKTEGFSSLSPHGHSWYQANLDYYREHIETVSRDDLGLAVRVLEENKDLLDRGARFLVHGDLYLKNMFWSSAGGLVISDWELLHLGNLAFDLGFIWSLSFRNTNWQNRLLCRFEDEVSLERGPDVFRKLFRIVIISTSLRFIRHSEIMLGSILSESQKMARKNAREALEVHCQTLQEVLLDKRFPFW